MQKFIKKPIEIEAVQFTDENKNQVYSWATWIQQNVRHGWSEDGKPCLKVPTPEGEMICSLGDYLIKEPFPTDWRKLYPCKPSIFEQTYQPLGDSLPLAEILARLIEAHNGLAKSGLTMDQYNPISLDLARAKIKLNAVMQRPTAQTGLSGFQTASFQPEKSPAPFAPNDKIVWDSGAGYEIGYFISEKGVLPATYAVHIITGVCTGEVSHQIGQIKPYSKELIKELTAKYGYEKDWSETF